MIKITVPSLPVRKMSGVSKANKPYDLTFQTIYCHTADQTGAPLPFPEKVEIILEKEQAPHAAGEYQLLPNSLFVDRDGRLAVAPKLTPLKRG